jgi:hypothetical protein
VVLAAIWLMVAATRFETRTGRSRNVRLLTLDRPFPRAGRFAADPYAGPQICADCHPGEAALHSRSGHAQTLRPAGQRLLARRLDGRTVADPELPAVRWSYRLRGGQLHVARTASRVEECVAEYAFGSGRHATTFVNVIDPGIPAILEHRLTYFTLDGVLGLTPGHEVKPPPPGLTPMGGVPPPNSARTCFECHTTQISARGGPRIDEETMIPNVSCERCHGPGRAHVTAARNGLARSQIAMSFGPDRWTAESLLALCGNCHRHPAGPRPVEIRRDDPNLARFQPIGLLQSKCYRQSAGTLSCLTCHDPHAETSSNRRDYDAICQNCHGRAAPPVELGLGVTRPRVVCAVEPDGRCVECHMPRMRVGQHIRLSDHWIRVRAEGRPTRGDTGANARAGPGGLR